MTKDERSPPKNAIRSLPSSALLLLVLLCLAVAGARYLLRSTASEAHELPQSAATVTPFRPLAEETEEALAAITRARQSLRSDLEAAADELATAADAIRRLRRFYVPVAEARQHAWAARQRELEGDSRQAAGELETMEQILLAASAQDEQVARELRGQLAALAAARSLVASGEPGAAEQIEQLGHSLDLLILKGNLALAGSGLEQR
jgi:vacuolar-type H+-ATPase subunit I/STV1